MLITKKEFYNDSREKNNEAVHLWPYYEKAIQAFSGLEPDSKILDIGCGDGTFGSLLKARLNLENLYGVDISERAVGAALRHRIEAQVLDIDSENLPYAGDWFDGIFCGQLIEHLFDPDHLLDEIFRVLKRNGRCALITPNLASWYNRIALLFGYQPAFTEVSLRHPAGYLLPIWLKGGHLRIFTLRALVSLARTHKFTIKAIIGFGIDTTIGFGKRLKGIAKLANLLTGRFPSLSSHIMIVLGKS